MQQFGGKSFCGYHYSITGNVSWPTLASRIGRLTRAANAANGVPHPLVVAVVGHGEPAEPGAEETADLMGEQGQAEQGGQIAGAEQFAHQAGGGRHGREPGEAEEAGCS